MIDTGPRGPCHVQFELHHHKGWVMAPVLAEAIGVDVDVVTAVGDYPKYFQVREGRVGHQQWVRAVGRATWQDRVGRAAPRHYADWVKLLADGSAPTARPRTRRSAAAAMPMEEPPLCGASAGRAARSDSASMSERGRSPDAALTAQRWAVRAPRW